MSRQKEGTNYFKNLNYQKMVIIEVNLIILVEKENQIDKDFGDFFIPATGSSHRR